MNNKSDNYTVGLSLNKNKKCYNFTFMNPRLRERVSGNSLRVKRGTNTKDLDTALELKVELETIINDSREWIVSGSGIVKSVLNNISANENNYLLSTDNGNIIINTNTEYLKIPSWILLVDVVDDTNRLYVNTIYYLLDLIGAEVNKETASKVFLDNLRDVDCSSTNLVLDDTIEFELPNHCFLIQLKDSNVLVEDLLNSDNHCVIKTSDELDLKFKRCLYEGEK